MTRSRDRSTIRKGQFVTKDLSREFPEFEDVLQSAGPVPSAAELAAYWTREAEREQLAAQLKRRTARQRK